LIELCGVVIEQVRRLTIDFTLVKVGNIRKRVGMSDTVHNECGPNIEEPEVEGSCQSNSAREVIVVLSIYVGLGMGDYDKNFVYLNELIFF